MLILLPASDAKHPIASGEPLDLEHLSFPGLGATRAEVLEALIEVSGRPDAVARLGVRPSFEEVVRRNLDLRDAPTAAVEQVYAGVLYDALDVASLDAASRRRARSSIVVISALWGAVRLGDRIPSYRLDMCGSLPGVAHLPVVWRSALAPVLPAAARRGIVIDCRSGDYASAWRPAGELAQRTLVVRVVRDLAGDAGAPGHDAKRARGLLVRRLISDAIDPADPEALAPALSDHFDVDLVRPERPGQSWLLRVAAPRA